MPRYFDSLFPRAILLGLLTTFAVIPAHSQSRVPDTTSIEYQYYPGASPAPAAIPIEEFQEPYFADDVEPSPAPIFDPSSINVSDLEQYPDGEYSDTRPVTYDAEAIESNLDAILDVADEFGCENIAGLEVDLTTQNDADLVSTEGGFGGDAFLQTSRIATELATATQVECAPEEEAKSYRVTADFITYEFWLEPFPIPGFGTILIPVYKKTHKEAAKPFVSKPTKLGPDVVKKAFRDELLKVAAQNTAVEYDDKRKGHTLWLVTVSSLEDMKIEEVN